MLVEVIIGGVPQGDDKKAGPFGCSPGLCAAAHVQYYGGSSRTPLVPCAGKMCTGAPIFRVRTAVMTTI